MSPAEQTQASFFAPIGETAARLAHAAEQPDAAEEHEEECMPEGVDSIESLCMHCGKNGRTRMLLTSIPFFREVIVVSFRCPHCHHANNSIQSAGQIQPRGAVYTVKNVHRPADLNRQVIKSEHGVVRIKELELEIPKGHGKMTTVEGLLRDTIDDLSLNQPARKHLDPLVHAKIDELLARLAEVLQFRAQPLTIELEDITGNSFIEAIDGLNDPHWTKREFLRSPAQNAELGLAPQSAGQEQPPAGGLTDDYEGENPEEVYSFPATCGSCGHTLNTRMKKIEIPHFKEIILMSTNCAHCGYKDNEVKSATAIAPKGTKLVLRVADKEDLARDILKSDTAELTIPEIDLHLNPGTLGGRFTTLEGLLTQVFEELDQKVFATGDSLSTASPAHPSPGPEEGQNHSKSSMKIFMDKFKAILSVDTPFTVILDDPISNSFVQNIYVPDDDPAIEKTEYERSFEQNEELGLNDMRTENYAPSS
ncbi:hypothetical protein PtA15_4A738 [Puccinia triticina]|uniref:Zinc finger ZPR1-type domain-containing protein n=1 Tax=Puccinia triticina TaxID=208348 RepID=A0ABY7CHP9_9BASI|nr:uncharacterized protein PtA15_4A738 [Puccinia triticina]WAQ84285.1 hypothetical protein PtA15_4A738 [Puccinia triticina]